jgi:hypothetical protein
VKQILGAQGVVLFAAAAVLVALVVVIFVFFWFATRPPPQPKFGYAGDWRFQSVSGVEERVLPQAERMWQDYNSWQPKTNVFTQRVYLARLGGMIRQTQFTWSHTRGDTPAGAQDYTHVDFIYTDPMNGAYALSWTLRGKHSPDFLRFDNTERLYQLRPSGSPDDKPPKLEIVGIEGIQPGH